MAANLKINPNRAGLNADQSTKREGGDSRAQGVGGFHTGASTINPASYGFIRAVRLPALLICSPHAFRTGAPWVKHSQGGAAASGLMD